MLQDVNNMNKGVESHEGCHIHGWMHVQRVAGNFHISVHVEDYMMLAQVPLLTLVHTLLYQVIRIQMPSVEPQ